MKYLLLIALSVMLNGCLTRIDTQFEPIDETSEYVIYQYRALAHDDNVDSKEERRMKWLETWLKQTGNANKKYEIIDRKEYVVNESIGAKRIYYKIKVYK